MELAHAEQRSYYTYSAMLWNFLGSYPQNERNASRFPLKSSAKIHTFLQLTKFIFFIQTKTIADRAFERSTTYSQNY